MLGKLLLNPYTLGALALAFVGMSAVILYYRSSALSYQIEVVKGRATVDRLTKEREQIVAISAQKDAEIARLTRQAEINNKIMSDLHVSLQELSVKADQTNQALGALETSDASVKTFLDTPLPNGLRQLLNKQ